MDLIQLLADSDHNNHCGYKLPGHASSGPGTRSEWLLRGNVVFATGNTVLGGGESDLDHGFCGHLQYPPQYDFRG